MEITPNIGKYTGLAKRHHIEADVNKLTEYAISGQTRVRQLRQPLGEFLLSQAACSCMAQP